MAESAIYNLPPTGLEFARDELLAKLASLLDENSNKLFNDVGLGVFFPGKEVPKKNTCPSARLWYESNEHEIDNVQFSASQRRAQIGLYLYNYSFLKDEQGNVVDIQTHCDRLSMWVLNNLREPDASGIGLNIQRPDIWSFEEKQMITVKNGNVLRRFDQNYAMPPGWFTTEIMFDISVQNIGR